MIGLTGATGRRGGQVARALGSRVGRLIVRDKFARTTDRR